MPIHSPPPATNDKKLEFLRKRLNEPGCTILGKARKGGLPGDIEGFINHFKANPSKLVSLYNEYNYTHLMDKFLKIKKGIGQDHRVICFSQKDACNQRDLQLLWGHYGSKHMGIAVVFDAKKLSEISENVKLKSVIYSNRRPMCDWAGTEINIQAMKQAMVTKNLTWSYENEVRLIVETQQCRLDEELSSTERAEARFFQIPPVAIEEVICGVKCLDYLKNNNLSGELETALNQADLSHVALKVLELDKSDFKFHEKLIKR